MKPNEEHERMLRELSLLNRKIRYHRVDAKPRIERMIEEEIKNLLIQQSILSNRMLVEGVSKTRIGRAMGTTNWETINSVLGMAGPELVASEEVTGIRGDGWSYDRSTETLTLSNWRNRHKNAMDSKPLKVAMQIAVPNGELEPSSYREQVYESGVDARWFEELLTSLNVQIGYKHAAATTPDAEITELAMDFDRSVREAAMNRDWEDED